MSPSTMQQPLLKSGHYTAFGTVDYSAGIIDDVANLAAADGTIATDADLYDDTTVDVEINDAATIAHNRIDTASALSITRWHH